MGEVFGHFDVRDHRMADRPATAGTADRLAILRRHSWIGQLSPAVIERLGSYAKRRRVSNGTVIFAEGDPGTGLMAVLAGAVKISARSPDGRDIVVNIVHEGDIFGEIALLDGHPRTADATAVTDCELMEIERRDFLPFLHSQPDVAMQIMQTLCSRLRRTTDQVQDLTCLNLPARLAKMLLRLSADAERLGSSAPRVAITQREISQMIGTSRESTNKQLRSWTKYGFIRLERGAVAVLRCDKLAEVAAQGSKADHS